MKVKDLINVLSTYDQDTNVAITLEGAKHTFSVDNVSLYYYCVLLECIDCPEFDDIAGMAQTTVNENENLMESWQVDALNDLVYEAEDRGVI